MTLAQIQHALGLGCLTPGLDLGREVTSAHASDLLSDALANAPAGGVLLTIQVHLNVVAVALHAQQAAVIFTWGMQPDEAVVTPGHRGGPAPVRRRGLHLRDRGPAVRPRRARRARVGAQGKA